MQPSVINKKAETAPRLSEKSYRLLYETITLGVLFQGADGKIISANPAAERILGLSLDQMMGRTSLDPRWRAIREDGLPISETEHPYMIALRSSKPYGPAKLGVYQPVLNDYVWISVTAIPLFENGDDVPSLVYTAIQDITAEQKANLHYQLLFNEMVDAFALHEIICNDQGIPVDYRFITVNPAFEKMTGLKSADILGKTVLEVLPDTESYWIETYGKVALTGESVEFENYAVATGKHFRVLAYQPAPMQFACTFADDTTRILAEQALRESEKKYSSYIENAPYAVFVPDEKGQFTEANRAASNITGYTREQLLNMCMRDITADESNDEAMHDSTLLHDTGRASSEIRYKHKDGSIRWWTIESVKISENRFLGYAFDITSKKQAESDLTFQSRRDFLTGLYNRRYYETELNRLDVEDQLPLSIIIGDINGLKMINDTFGHAAGDRLIIESARIIEGCCQPGDVVSRIGGDEYAVIMPKTDGDTAQQVMESIQTSLRDYDIKHNSLNLHAISLGYATKENPDEEIINVFKTAEDHLYRRKLLRSTSVHGNIVASIKATIIEKHHETEEHADRMATLAKALGMQMNLSESEMDEIELLATLHDIGKVAISDDILTKPGKLSEAEWSEMKRHPEIGYRIAMSSPELVFVAEGIFCHHEWWNGCGYPRGLSGENIPLSSRIIAVVDAYDAMTHDRPYRKALDPTAAIQIIKENSGTQFDPQIAEIFTNMMTKDNSFIE